MCDGAVRVEQSRTSHLPPVSGDSGQLQVWVRECPATPVKGETDPVRAPGGGVGRWSAQWKSSLQREKLPTGTVPGTLCDSLPGRLSVIGEADHCAVADNCLSQVSCWLQLASLSSLPDSIDRRYFCLLPQRESSAPNLSGFCWLLFCF